MATGSRASGNKAWADARAWVLDNGRRTGHEYLCAYNDRTWRAFGFHTDNSPDKVHLPHGLEQRALGGGSRVGIHHNHPNSSALTVVDIRNLAIYPSIYAIVAHAHDGSDYMAEAVEKGNILKELHAFESASLRILRNDPDAVRLNADGLLYKLRGHLLCSALEQANVIRYRFGLSRELDALYGSDRIVELIDRWLPLIVQSSTVTRR